MGTKDETESAVGVGIDDGAGGSGDGAGVGAGVGAAAETTGENAPVRFDTKIAVLLRDDLEQWQRLNVCAFLVGGLGTASPEVVGEPYADADGTEYLPMFRQPVLIFEGSKERLTAAHGRAVSRGLREAVFTSDLFGTGNDRDNRAAVSAVGGDGLDLVGIAVYGPRNAVDKVFKGTHMHP
ncbi:DUF2000 domain-containing protein [Streptomyces sp. SID3343]|uniref:DUF2000 domain-containing protein n=1 Tax=Streptomyces sp. SID3343 TaxID=2690260 RepID=UPI00136CFBE3|nr:DUF2000 domain-containing protein [Streptomyces sp. SID3343]MYW02145.1 DUF2000 family protein [Streptomyces sp. SID3343]